MSRSTRRAVALMRSGRGRLAVWIRCAASSSPAMRAPRSRWTCTTPSSDLRCRVDSASASTSRTPEISSRYSPGVAASNSMRCERNRPNAPANGSVTKASISNAALSGCGGAWPRSPASRKKRRHRLSGGAHSAGGVAVQSSRFSEVAMELVPKLRTIECTELCTRSRSPISNSCLRSSADRPGPRGHRSLRRSDRRGASSSRREPRRPARSAPASGRRSGWSSSRPLRSPG